MIFLIFISIVFIAELIIAFSTIMTLRRFSLTVRTLDETITLMKPDIKDVCALTAGISGQIKELCRRFVQKVHGMRDDLPVKILAWFLMFHLLRKLSIKVSGKYKKSLFLKVLAKGLTLLQFVV